MDIYFWKTFVILLVKKWNTFNILLHTLVASYNLAGANYTVIYWNNFLYLSHRIV